MIPASLLGTLIRCIQQCIHFRLLEICDCRLRCSLAWNGAELPAPLDALGTMQPNKAGQRVDRGQPLVAIHSLARFVGLHSPECIERSEEHTSELQSPM